MKSIGIKSVVLLAVISLFTVFGSMEVKAGTYIGEVCWDVSFTTPVGTGGIVRVGVTDMGGGHYLLNGKATSKDDPPKVTAIHGNAELEGSQILVTGVAGGTNADGTWGHVGNWVLDASTLNGTINRVGTYYNSNSTAFNNYYDVGTVTFISCP